MKVRITLEMDQHFIKMLKATVGIKGLGNASDVNGDYRRHTAMDALGVVVLFEARGAPEDQVHAETPLEWRPHINAVSEERSVIQEASLPSAEEKGLIWGDNKTNET